MNHFIPVFRDGLLVLGENWQVVLVILALILLGQFVMQRVMRSIFGERLRGEEYFSLGIAGWLLPACLLSMLWYILRISILPGVYAGIFIALFAILAASLFFRAEARSVSISRVALAALLASLLLSIPLRLAFMLDLVLPQYFDSTRHYTIIENILSSIEPGRPVSILPWLTTDYYHVGFHFLAAFISSIGSANISQTMLVLGQMILAVTPLSVFFLVRYATGSDSAGIFSLLLAGFGWSMPAYALNWGKYPAVTSLALVPFVLSTAYLTAKSGDELTKQKKWMLYAVLAAAILVSGMLHSRSLVLIAFAVLAWTAAGWWQRLQTPFQSFVFYALVTGVLAAGAFIDRQEILEPLLNPYLRQNLLSTGLTLLLSIFAYRVFPKWTFANLAAIFLLFGALFIPATGLIPRLASLTLLDRTFVEIALYLPLSLLGGFGLAGLAQTLKQARTVPLLRGPYLSALFMVFLVGNTLVQYEFRPSDCCTIIGRDDMAAMEWIRRNLPADAQIVISADESTVLPSGALQGYAPADAGAWVTPLTGRITVPMLYDTNLSKDKKFQSLCKLGIDYIYVGGVGLGFHAPRLREHPDWYKPVLSLSRVEVYQVIGCR